MISCGGSSSTTSGNTARRRSRRRRRKAGRPNTAGTVTGTIKLDGAAPKMKVINMAAEPSCAKIHTSPAMTEDVVAGDGGTLQNVVVYLKGDFSQYPSSICPGGDRSEGLPVLSARPGPDDQSALQRRQFRHDHA